MLVSCIWFLLYASAANMLASHDARRRKIQEQIAGA